MTIELNREQEKRLDQLMKSGKFESVEQFIDYSLSAVTDDDPEHTAWLKSEIEKGLASLDAGKHSNLSTDEIAAMGSYRGSPRPHDS